MKKQTAIKLFVENKRYTNAKNRAYSLLLESRTEIAEMKSAVCFEYNGDDKWDVADEIEALYNQFSSLLKKVNRKF